MRMKKHYFALAAVPVFFVITVAAQRPADAPATMTAAKAPDTVFIEELTWAEVRDLTASGTTNVIVGTAGTEQKGPHMVDGAQVHHGIRRRQDRARHGPHAGGACRHLRARRQLGSAERPHALSGNDHLARGSLRRAARAGRPQPESGRLQ